MSDKHRAFSKPISIGGRAPSGKNDLGASAYAGGSLGGHSGRFLSDGNFDPPQPHIGSLQTPTDAQIPFLALPPPSLEDSSVLGSSFRASNMNESIRASVAPNEVAASCPSMFTFAGRIQGASSARANTRSPLVVFGGAKESTGDASMPSSGASASTTSPVEEHVATVAGFTDDQMEDSLKKYIRRSITGTDGANEVSESLAALQGLGHQGGLRDDDDYGDEGDGDKDLDGGGEDMPFKLDLQ